MSQDFDSVVSIGGQSLLDGVLRLLGPALRALPPQLPIQLPGLAASTLLIRSLTPRPLDAQGRLPVHVRFDLAGEVTLPSISSMTVGLPISGGTLDLPVGDLIRAIRVPAVGVDTHLPITGTSTGTLAGTLTGAVSHGLTGTLDGTVGGTVSGTLAGGAAGRVEIAGISLTSAVETLQAALHLGDLHLSLPIPVAAPVPVLLTPHEPLEATLSFPLQGVGGAATPVTADGGFGLVLGIGVPSVSLPRIQLDAQAIAEQLRTRLRAVVAQLAPHAAGDLVSQLLQGLDANALVGAIEGETSLLSREAVQARAYGLQQTVTRALASAFRPLAARTGRLVSPPAPAGAPCAVAVAPSAAAARLAPLPDGGVALQVGFARQPIPDAPAWPDLALDDGFDVQVDVGFALLAPLLQCLIEALPNFGFHGAQTTMGESKLEIVWSDVTLDLWPLMLAGTLTLDTVGDPGQPKTLQLQGSFAAHDDLLNVTLSFQRSLELRLTDLAEITGLSALDGPPPAVKVDTGTGVKVGAAIAAIFSGGIASADLGPALLIPVLTQILGDQLERVLDKVLNPTRGLVSPPAVPKGLFDAFGPLVQRVLEIDDLRVRGTLATPTSPWQLLPLSDPAGGLGVKPSTGRWPPLGG